MAQAQGSIDTNKKVESEWISYRDAYKTMVWFEKFGKSKNLIQNRFQIVVKEKQISFDTVRLTLNSKSGVMNLNLDPLGQTQLPLLTAAYNENVELSITPRIGQFSFRSRVSILLRADGNYEMSDLRAACEQNLSFLSYLDPTNMSGKKCVGVKFGFDKKDSNVAVELRTHNATNHAVMIQENAFLWQDSNIQLKVAQVRFDTNPDKSHLITRGSPLIAIAIIE